MAAEWLAWEAATQNGTRWAIVAPTFGDVRDVCAEGNSGIIGILREYGVLEDYNRTYGHIKLTNGSLIRLFSADEPNRLRGPQFHGAWCDELSSWRYSDTWDQLQFGLRLGDHPRTVVTTTPKPVQLVRNLVARKDGSIHIVRGSTFDNAANLAPQALIELQLRYNGTRLGRQELYGELLEDIEGALWTRKIIDDARVKETPNLTRICVAIDPAVTSGEDSDETGIVVAGVSMDGQYYVLHDGTLRASPDSWARKAVELYHQYKANRIVAEKNNVPIKLVTASRGKQVRAEPVSALYEQGKVHHVGGFNELEDQMVSWTPDSGTSPDRMDALVWAITELSVASPAMQYLAHKVDFCPSCRMPSPKGTAFCPKCQTAIITSGGA
jgi:phage terminase large subunit-like protein